MKTKDLLKQKINFGLNENHNIKFIYQPKSEGEKFLTIKTKPIRGELTEKIIQFLLR